MIIQLNRLIFLGANVACLSLIYICIFSKQHAQVPPNGVIISEGLVSEITSLLPRHAEAKAFLLALSIATTYKWSKIFIYSDSLFLINSLKSTKSTIGD